MARGKSLKNKKLIEAAYEILQAIHPASVRAVCYKLFAQNLIANMSEGETNRVSKQLTDARETGKIPWEWIVDATRKPKRPGVWSSPRSFAEAVTQGFRLDPWDQQPVRIEVWSEKGTVESILSPILDEYAVTFRVLRGWNSTTAVYDIAQESQLFAKRDKPFIALYVGDWDPSGMYMSERDLPDRIAEYGGEVDLKRVALLSSDLAGLSSFPLASKLKDSRSRWYSQTYGKSGKCWELDALDPRELRDRVKSSICDYIQWPAWDRCLLAEEAQRTSLQEGLAGFAKLGSK